MIAPPAMGVPMPYQVRWQLVGSSERPLDYGHIREAYNGYGDAMGAINEFLRPYPEVKHCDEEGTGSHGDQRTPTLLSGCGSSSTTIPRSAHRKSLHHRPHLLRLLRILEGSRSQSYPLWKGGMPELVFDRPCCNDPHNLSTGAWQLWRAAWRGGDRQSGPERQHIQRSMDCGASTFIRQLGGSSSVALKPRNQ